MLDSATFTIFDRNGEARHVAVETEEHGLVLKIPDPVNGKNALTTRVLLEFRSGVPYLSIWADRKREEPTSVITLEQTEP